MLAAQLPFPGNGYMPGRIGQSGLGPSSVIAEVVCLHSSTSCMITGDRCLSLVGVMPKIVVI